MTKDEALKLALEALERCDDGERSTFKAITAIKEALANPPLPVQPVQEPVAWLNLEKLAVGGMAYATAWKTTEKQSPLYTTPPAAHNAKQFDQRQPLTDEWIRQTEEDAASMTAKDMTGFDCLKWLVRKTEAAHGITDPLADGGKVMGDQA